MMNMVKIPLGIVDFCNYEESLPALMELLGAAPVLGSQKRVVIKPNLVNSSPPPITTSVKLVAMLVKYVASVSDAEIVVAEGCGIPLYNTDRPYRKLGYFELAKSKEVVLVDLNFLSSKIPQILYPKNLYDIIFSKRVNNSE
jgi:uncharacterized protein (DUF362 family)